ncbi:unnamed protein product [Symbiodinium natans]|uniref:Uncharacterized protein n=1 Tax=Symbiodinium natans TaxID=878477 RepID=A0A812KW83_9DINO|nr:unnamed protein product [Symbiodinium natans]
MARQLRSKLAAARSPAELEKLLGQLEPANCEQLDISTLTALVHRLGAGQRSGLRQLRSALAKRMPRATGLQLAKQAWALGRLSRVKGDGPMAKDGAVKLRSSFHNSASAWRPTHPQLRLRLSPQPPGPPPGSSTPFPFCPPSPPWRACAHRMLP